MEWRLHLLCISRSCCARHRSHMKFAEGYETLCASKSEWNKLHITDFIEQASKPQVQADM